MHTYNYGEVILCIIFSLNREILNDMFLKIAQLIVPNHWTRLLKN